jgi:hypothetical protein
VALAEHNDDGHARTDQREQVMVASNAKGPTAQAVGALYAAVAWVSKGYFATSTRWPESVNELLNSSVHADSEIRRRHQTETTLGGHDDRLRAPQRKP